MRKVKFGQKRAQKIYLYRILQLRLQFDDTAVSTYEYPSEASLLEDIPITPPSSLSLSESMNDSDNRSEESQPVIASHANSSTTGATLSTLKTNLALGGSSGNHCYRCLCYYLTCWRSLCNNRPLEAKIKPKKFNIPNYGSKAQLECTCNRAS